MFKRKNTTVSNEAYDALQRRFASVTAGWVEVEKKLFEQNRKLERILDRLEIADEERKKITDRVIY